MPLVVVALAELALGKTQRPGPAPGQVIVRCCWFERPIPGRRCEEAVSSSAFLCVEKTQGSTQAAAVAPAAASGADGSDLVHWVDGGFVPSDRSSSIVLHSRAVCSRLLACGIEGAAVWAECDLLGYVSLLFDSAERFFF